MHVQATDRNPLALVTFQKLKFDPERFVNSNKLRLLRFSREAQRQGWDLGVIDDIIHDCQDRPERLSYYCKSEADA